MEFRQTITVPFGAVRIVESEHAKSLPDGEPRTDDMRAMVEHLDRLGEIRSRPAAFLSGDTMIIHPALKVQLDRRIAAQHRRSVDQAFFDAVMPSDDR